MSFTVKQTTGVLNPQGEALAALAPDTILVDEKTLSQRLSFMASFSRLILFFDQNNEVDGTWQRLLLKDPIILLAAIAHMDYRARHSLFLMLKTRLVDSDDDQAIFVAPEPGFTNQPKLVVESKYTQWFNQLLGLLLAIFEDINHWLEQMRQDDKKYQLKAFVEQQVTNSISPLLSQYVTIFELAYANYQHIVEPNYKVFQSFCKFWRRDFNQVPGHLKQGTDLVELTMQVYYQVFGFYVQVIESAKDSFDDLSQQTNNYPDTAMFVAFAKLLEIQQRELNRLTRKHLDFYYYDVLKQLNQPAQADSTYVELALKDDASGFDLPQGTVFDAGVDANGDPIYFKSVASQYINQGQIAKVQTLRYLAPTDTTAGVLNLTDVDNVNQVNKDPQGQIITWPLLGDVAGGTELNQGFCIGSPMLYLTAGVRELTVELCFADSVISAAQLEDSQCFLSTATDWLAVTPSDVNLQDDSLSVVISLDSKQPAIEAFTTNPDGFVSQWPLLKLVLSPTIDLTATVNITNINLSCKVSEFSNVELYNDISVLDGTSPFTPFGQLVPSESNFYLGSSELFAKSLTSLVIDVKWSQLPTDMVSYYQQYNLYYALNPTFTATGETQDDLVKLKNQYSVPFNNDCFDCNMAWFDGSNWQNIAVATYKPDDELNFAAPDYPHTIDADEKYLFSLFIEQQASVPAATKVKNPITLVSTQSAAEDGETSGNFFAGILYSENQYVFCAEAIKTIKADVDLIASGLNFTQGQKNGFVALTLSAPTAGFGNSVYPQVVSFVTQQNALEMIEVAKLFGSTKKFEPVPMPNVPYVPTISQIQLSYAAAESIDIAAEQPIGTLDFYHIDIFSTYPVLSLGDSPLTGVMSGGVTQSAGLTESDDSDDSDDSEADNQTLAAFAGIKALGTGYVVLTGLEVPCNLSVYFELSDLTAIFADTEASSISLYYLSLSGWRSLQVLSDTTDNFACSGMIELYFPADTALSASDNDGLIPAIDAKDPSQPQAVLAITSNNSQQQIPQVVYVNTQAVQVSREFSNLKQQLDTRNKPQLAASQITAVLDVSDEISEQIDSVQQPFASSGGETAENEVEFYRRVSNRINDKARVNSSADLMNQAFKADSSLYYCQWLESTEVSATTGVNLAVVQGYDNDDNSDAYFPISSGCQLDNITAFLAKKMSPFAKLKVFNFSHVVIQVTATLQFDANVSVNKLSQQLQSGLRLYLSPWIVSDSEQRNLQTDLTRADLIRFFDQQDGVAAVSELKVTLDDVDSKEQVFVVASNQILVADATQNIVQDTSSDRVSVIGAGRQL